MVGDAYKPSGKIGPLSCRGPPCLRGCLGLRPEASKTSLSFFSILKDSNKLTAVSMLWVALPGLETGKHLSCQHQFPPKTPGGLFCLCLQNDARLHLTRPCDDTHFGKGTRPYPCCGSASGQTSGNPKALCIYGLTVHSITFLWLPRPTQNSTAAMGLDFTGSHRFSGRKRNQGMGCDI